MAWAESRPKSEECDHAQCPSTQRHRTHTTAHTTRAHTPSVPSDSLLITKAKVNQQTCETLKRSNSVVGSRDGKMNRLGCRKNLARCVIFRDCKGELKSTRNLCGQRPGNSWRESVFFATWRGPTASQSWVLAPMPVAPTISEVMRTMRRGPSN